MKKHCIVFLTFFLLLTGCGKTEPANLMEEVPARVVCLAEVPELSCEATDFAIRLLQNTQKSEENTLVSPLSVLSALGMTANGADGETLSQMTEALGMTPEALNAYLYSYMDTQPEQLKLANALWLRDDDSLTIEQDFLETNANYYRADVFQTAFDSAALAQLNRWVEDRTGGMIPKILDRMDENAMLYLVNALAFEDMWETPYEVWQVHDGTFTTGDGKEQAVEMMYATESMYLEGENVTGFLKYYKDRNYAFAALLPDAGIDIQDYVNSLTGEALQNMLSSPTEAVVKTALPKFQTEFDTDLADALRAMGMMDAFDAHIADFSRLGHSEQGNLYISRVLHKTAFTVAEEGTKAAAATVVEMLAGAAYNPDVKFVTLDRPFVYMLIDCRENLPFFIGVLADMDGRTPEAPAALPENPTLSEPPQLTISWDGRQEVIHPSSFEWQLPAEGNVLQTIIACGAAPLDLAGQEPLVTAGEVRLQWETPPDSFEAIGWSLHSESPISLHAKEEWILLSGSSCDVVEIKATWNEGNASYVFAVK